MENAINKAARLAGGKSALAKKLNEKFGFKLSPQSVNQYCKSGVAPPKLCIPIEQELQRRVTRYQLRPDVFGSPPDAHKKIIPACVIILLENAEPVTA